MRLRVTPSSTVLGVFGCALISVGCGTASSHYGQGLDAAPAADAAAATPDARLDDAPSDQSVGPRDVPLATDAPSPTDAAAPVLPLDVAADEQWHWVEVPGALCGNGSTGGIGVNRAGASDQVLIFLEGGGACWDAASCYGIVQTSLYLGSGYGATEFATDPQRVLLPLQRGDANNPFRDMNLVYVPYCTGDVHAGEHVVTYQYAGIDHLTHHVGGSNLSLFMARIERTFPSLRRVWLAGDSAGGFGAALGLPRARAAFPRATVDVLDDSGQPIEPTPGRWAQWRDAWGLRFPPDCAGCDERIGAIVDYYRARYTDSRLGLISYSHDAVISTFMGLTPTQFNAELLATADRIDGTWPGARYFFINGPLHVGLTTPSPELLRWLRAMVNDEPAWTSVRP